MGLINKPLFLDFAFGRVGTFIRTEQSTGKFPLTVVYTPINSWRQVKIYDVPENALIQVPRFDPRIPYEIMVLVAGEHGEAPLIKRLNMHFDELAKRVEEIRRAAAYKIAAAETTKRILERGSSSVLDEQLKKLKSLRQTFYPYGGDELRKRRFLGEND